MGMNVKKILVMNQANELSGGIAKLFTVTRGGLSKKFNTGLV